ncbi:TPA: thymidylate kinase [Candidatus Woesearchaeota archaeon]|nr:thymidylate kinase [archaeon]HIJ10831.1 thymidylate kinase [Candidatus Woesearchaeota archaeon]
MQGTLIVIDGIDGSGKGTQTKLVVQRLEEEGYNVKMADFPRYDEWSSAFVSRYLRGEFGKANEVTPKQASLFYALDRYAASSQIRQWLREGAIVISNRYVSASKGHQLGKLINQDEMNEYLSWLNELEYGTLQIPKPDCTIFLHMPPVIGQKLVEQKQAREYLQGATKDIHEADLSHLQNAERAFLFCVTNDAHENWHHIVCAEGNQPRTVESINNELYQKIKEIITLPPP